MKISQGVVHQVPNDLKKALRSNKDILKKWESLTPLARNEWICWVEEMKSVKKRQEHIVRVCRELEQGKRRPCCWIGCIHRKDKPLSASQKFILGKRKKK